MLARRLAALLCLLALLAPAGAALALEPGSSGCVDACCEESGCDDAPGAPCTDGDDGDCPAGCPDCACSARTRVATPADDVLPRPSAAAVLAHPVPGDDDESDSDPREILHVPRG